jgi:hypothetical protein
MSDPVEPLIQDLLHFVAPGGRSYRDVMEAWRTSCPRFPVWEEALERGLVARSWREGESQVILTDAGRSVLGARP